LTDNGGQSSGGDGVGDDTNQALRVTAGTYISEYQIACGVNGKARWRVQLRRSRGSSIGKRSRTVASECVDRSGDNLANAVVH